MKRFVPNIATLLPYITIGSELVFLLWRMRYRFAEPTLFAEESFIYFQYAFNHSWLNALVMPHDGYYDFWINLVSIIAADILPIEYAPYVFVAGAIVVPLAISIVIFLPGSPFTAPWSKIAAILLMLTAAPMYGDFRPTYSHFYGAVMAALLLISSSKTVREQAIYYAFMVFSLLLGPVCLFTLPAFALAYYFERSQRYLVYLGIMLCGIIIQLAAIYYWQSHGLAMDGRVQHRFNINVDMTVFWIFAFGCVFPFAGGRAVRQLYPIVKQHLDDNLWSQEFVTLICLMSLIGFFTFLYGWHKNIRHHSILLLLFAMLCVSVASIYCVNLKHNDLLALPHKRYAVPMIILLGWICLLHVQKDTFLLSRAIYGLMVVALLSISIRNVRTDRIFHPVALWESEIAHWKQDPSYIITAGSGSRFQLLPKPGI